MQRYLVGIDGGGTSCRAAVADANGRIIGRGKSGASNIMTAPDTAIENMTEAARASFIDAGLDASLVESAHAYLGLAGNYVENTVAYVMPRLPFRQSVIESDGLIALQGALGEGNGTVAILGTGTIYIARTGADIRYLGGWGYHLGDLGGGARLGQMALQQCLLGHDGIAAQTAMTRAFLDDFDHDPRKMVAFSQAAKPGDYGRYAPRVFEFAATGDEAALAILRQSAGFIDLALDRMSQITGGGRLCLLGGLSGLYAPYLSARHRERFVPPAQDALSGAIALAKATYANVTETAV
ncbi:BadF/BadG/BcrA/BcrD ATPase family protein [Agrobacterium rosae]|uniref:BadF/BadG/BcrA/BcrD ATPase family protein n=1 Tax=Agrobacterium rosae TaxID=1972867 RepID=A0AAE5RYN8_9HYPH|nr:BadF/BadG/BcrA/BcrD ATPase family protein [Agrobacterium rosae]KAA3511434.1 N-acetylglucosamine kinase [Agrobacterium rosae]KAA3519142.1 N-acetylglucosamine kinase [Agrobacterium rosae]MBN7806961.1 N-acetylglucosamine kinase [Agrobacterium rosae]MCM2436218.1 N-acetylglucosamine kinase [Agrobacterium rosae]MDX8332249.1 BadF/BadG/BcrA/BcrD ATPase family protein [Agrobacterium rosae]